MPITLAAITPHSPLLIPTIGKDHQAALQPTMAAYENLAGELAQRRIETIVVIGDHGLLRSDVFTLSQTPTMTVDLKEFGDITTTKNWIGDLDFGNKLREKNETTLPLMTVATTKLSYIVGVPLLLLTKYLPEVKICPVGTALCSAEDHVTLGQLLRDTAENFTSRIALLAANDLAPSSLNEVEGVATRGEEFDQLIIKTVKEQTWSDLIKIDKLWTEQVTSLPWRNILVLSGALSNATWQPEILSYQAPLGVGLLTAVFRS